MSIQQMAHRLRKTLGLNIPKIHFELSSETHGVTDMDVLVKGF